jgi:hypothetical protein
MFEYGIRGHRDRFENFRMFLMDDALERRDKLAPGVYPRSLLYFVSGALEGEADALILGLHRHTTGAPPYDGEPGSLVHEYIAEDPSRLVLSRTADGSPAGMRSAASRHGDFDDDSSTLASLTAIISN